MAVTLPSDLIMDVMRNADPLRQQTVVAKLQEMGRRSDYSETFEAVFDVQTVKPATPVGPALSLSFADARSATREADTPYENFERMLLRNLFETLLPDSDSGSFGTGPSAGVWRSMAADQLAGVYTEAGGIGISRLLANKDGDIPTPQTQWPYFSLPKINGFEG